MSEQAWVLYLPINVPSQNTLYGNVRDHKAARWKYRGHRDKAELLFRSARNNKRIPPARGKRRVTWERILGPRQREYDEPNFVGGLKPIIDALVRVGLLVDDKPKYYEGRYGQVTERRGDGPALRVTLEDVGDS